MSSGRGHPKTRSEAHHTKPWLGRTPLAPLQHARFPLSTRHDSSGSSAIHPCTPPMSISLPLLAGGLPPLPRNSPLQKWLFPSRLPLSSPFLRIIKVILPTPLAPNSQRALEGSANHESQPAWRARRCPNA